MVDLSTQYADVPDEVFEAAFQTWYGEQIRPNTITEHRLRLRYDIKRMVSAEQERRHAAR